MMGCFSDGPYSSPAKAKSIFDGRKASHRPAFVTPKQDRATGRLQTNEWRNGRPTVEC
ncbi:hypothetical protein GGQ95_003451 [Anoxybacillus rupiensis]|nr:hypothetical protein [Anoxybacillus rupiensis]